MSLLTDPTLTTNPYGQYSEFYVNGGTVVTSSNAMAVQTAALSLASAHASHSWDGTGITVPPGQYVVVCEANWNATNSAVRTIGVYDGTFYRIHDGELASSSTSQLQSFTYRISATVATKLQLVFYVASTTGSTRTLASGSATRMTILRLP